MTDLPRITISLPSDIEAAVNAMKAPPEFSRVPKSKIVCGLAREGLETRNRNGEDTANGGKKRPPETVTSGGEKS